MLLAQRIPLNTTNGLVVQNQTVHKRRVKVYAAIPPHSGRIVLDTQHVGIKGGAMKGKQSVYLGVAALAVVVGGVSMTAVQADN